MSLLSNPMATVNSLFSVARPRQTLPRCLSLSLFPPQQRSLRLSVSSPPSLGCGGGGNFGGSNGGNFGKSDGGNGSEGDSGEMKLVTKDEINKFVADLRKTIIENNEKSAGGEEILYCINLYFIAVPLIVLLRSEIEDMKKAVFRDKIDKYVRSELALYELERYS